ncbi:unnamed protein product [Clavelina lepadiformis]|uniref:RRM domain-containing protein n=1 Tax=Clavelina lepadiformis TaxID=159417 RepID=A0ABP0GZH3_CLALP
MSTGVVIRLRNLPLVAGTIDIRNFFGGLQIPDGGVHIIGGNDGTAFILFATDEDARQAMLRDVEILCGSKIKLTLSSHTEMKNVIEDSQRICEELRGHRLPEPPITNLSGHSTASGYQTNQRHHQAKAPSPKITPEMPDMNDVHVEIKGMPFSVNENDIIYFFSPLSIVAVRFMLDEKSRKNGTGIVKFGSALEKREGMKRDRKYIGSRFVKLTSITERQWLLASSQPCETIRLGPNGNRKRTQSSISPNEVTPKRSRAFSPIKMDNCVEVRGLPPTATIKSVGDFFLGLRFLDGGLFVEMDGSVCRGSAYVEFSSYSDYKQALDKDGDMLNGKQVRVIGLPKQSMIDQIRHHKKYIKSKREEEYNRERMQQEKEKKLRERKMLEEENLQKKREHQLRKQKEMDEWLRRQHEKEESGRKRLELEKQITSSDISRQKLIEQIRYEEEQNLREALVKEELQKQIEEERMKLSREDVVTGAGEMDIEEDSSNTTSNIVTSMPLVGQSAPNIMQASPAGFPTIFSRGNSGTMVAPTVPIGLSPSLPVVNPPSFGVPSVPTFQSGFQNNLPPNLLLAKPAILNTAPPSIVSPPPMPPPLGPPPPVPPVMIPPGANLPPAPFLTPQPANRQLPPTNEAITSSNFVRIANSPYNANEDAVRNFFQGLKISKNGIQFVNKANGDRSGHIFVKFSSSEDAAKAALKDDQKFMGRSVLVKQATMSNFGQIYTKITKGGTFKPIFDNDDNDESFFTKRILDDRMTCVCIGNAPPNTVEEDVINIMGNIRYVPNRVVVIRNLEGKCKGEVYVELINSDECVKAANLHGQVKISGEIIRVLPLTIQAMNNDIRGHEKKVATQKQNSNNAGFQNSKPQSNGSGKKFESSPHYHDRHNIPPWRAPANRLRPNDVPRFDGPPPPISASNFTSWSSKRRLFYKANDGFTFTFIFR